MNENKKKLALKFRLIIGTIGVLIYLVVVLIGSYRYYKSIIDFYNMQAYDSAEVAEGYFSTQELKEYADMAYGFNHGTVTEEERDAVMESPKYKELFDRLAKLRDAISATDVYVFTVDKDVFDEFVDSGMTDTEKKSLYYIMDAYYKEDEIYSIGDKGGVSPMFVPALQMGLSTGEIWDGRLIIDGDFGYIMTAWLPVVYDGQTVAFVGVEIPMRLLIGSLMNFALYTSLAVAAVMILVLYVGGRILMTTVVRPVRLVAEEAESFIKSGNQVSEKLGSIKTGDEIQILSESLLAMEIGINEYIENVKKLTAEKERIGAELNVATQIQADMLPRIFPAFPGRKEFDLYALMDPAKEVGGDFYDFFLIDDDHLGLVMADVSGKGVPAALFMVIAKTLIKNRALMGGSPAEILAYANDQLCEGNEAELFVTVWLGIIEISTGKGMAANAGHEHPVIRRAGGDFELVIYKHSPAVATMEGMRFREHEFEVHPGDSLFVYTDGVPEATDANNVLFGNERMLKALNKNPDAMPEEMLKNVYDAVFEFVGDAPQFDDLTMLGIKFK